MFKSMTTNLMVESVDDSVAFYQSVLGFDVNMSVPSENGQLQFAMVAKDGLNLMFQERINLTKEYPCLEMPTTKPSGTIYIKVDNFSEVYNDIKNKHTILCEIHKTFYGSKEFAINDNNGYVLTFTEHKQ